jgi:5-methylcytosine-specific restriction endonuclease McrA
MKVDREIIYDKCNYRCAYCGEQLLFKDMQIDHIIPQSNFIMHIKNKYKVPEFLKHLTENDLNHYDNLLPTCRVCNKWKDTFDLESFRYELSEQTKRLTQYSSSYRIAKKYGLIEETKKPIVFYFETILNYQS